jgi:uncharacterized membrane protein YbhN (UPF0104 family)
LKARSFFLKSIGLVLFIGLFIYASPGDVIESLQRADLALLGFAGAFALTGVVVKNVRWKYILSLSGGQIRWRDLLPLAFISAFFGNVTPGRFGDLWKISFADSATFSRSQGLISFVYDRLLDACTMAILALIGTLAIDHFRNAAFAGILVLVLGAGVAAFLFRAPLSRTLERLLARFDVSVAEPATAPKHRGFLAAGILASHLLYLVLYFATYQYLFAAVGIVVPLPYLVLTGSIAAMAAVVPITVSGLGTREAVLLYFLEPFYTSPGQVILAGLLWVFVLTYLLSGIVALPLWLLGLPRKPGAQSVEGPR